MRDHPIKSLLLNFVLIVILSASDTLTLKQVILDYKELTPENLEQLHWISKTDYFVFCQDSVVYQQSKPGDARDILYLNDLNGSLQKCGLSQLKSLPYMHWHNTDTFYFWKGDTLILYDLQGDTVTQMTVLPDSAENKDISNKDFHIAYTMENNLYIKKADGSQHQLTDKEKEIVSGQSVARHEFGIHGGTFWSPRDSYLAFYQKDESRVDDYPFVNYDSLPAVLQSGKYPMAGRSSEYVRVGVFNLDTNKILWLPTDKRDEPEQYLTSVTWSPDEKYLYIAHISRDQDRLQMVRYDILNNGKPLLLFSEEDGEYIDPQYGLFFRENYPDEFLWFSERDGWNHLYLYRNNGTLIRQVSSGPYDVRDFIGFSADGKWVYYAAAVDNPTERHIFKSHIETGKRIKLTNQRGTYRADKSEISDHLLLRYSSLDTPRDILLSNGDGEILDTLLSAENPLKDFLIGETVINSFETESGVKLFYRIIYPPDFKETQKYPVLVYVYGGPHSQNVQNAWLGRSNLWLQYMATQGYLVYTLDNRGTDYRGVEFEQVTHSRLGTVEVSDQALGVQNLITQPYVDLARIGVFGWSYGGFMTASLMMRKPHLFKAGVAGAPVIDWKYYEVMYTERYMETPQENPEGYEQASVLTHLDSLQGDLLVIHGTSDDIVMWQHSIVFVKEAIKKNKQIEYMIYPGHLHGVRGRDRYHLYQKITDYFNYHLKSERIPYVPGGDDG